MDWLLTFIVAIVGTLVDNWKQVPNWGWAALYLLWTLNKDIVKLRAQVKERSDEIALLRHELKERCEQLTNTVEENSLFIRMRLWDLGLDIDEALAPQTQE